MDKNQNVRISEDNLDQLIQINLERSYFEIQKERYDNDFDLARQFRIERNRSRNFRIYGVINSTVIDCNNLTLEVYSDAALTNLITTVQTTPYAFDEKNVFGQRNGKYLIQLNNFEFETIYIRLTSDDFYYEEQVFEQKLVFLDADGNFVEYGTQTVDIDVLAETAVEINNDFPFFFNKHWIRKDLPIKDEKPAKISFSFVEQELQEGQGFDSIISLDKPSPFGNETCLLNMAAPSLNYPFFNGQVASTTFEGDDPNVATFFRELNVPEGSPLAPFNGKTVIYIAAPEQVLPLIEAGLFLTLDNGDYTGTHQILFSQSVNFEFTNELDEVISNWVRRQIVLDVDYNPDFANTDPTFSAIYTLTVGDAQDIAVSINGEVVNLPYLLTWEENEQFKDLNITANNDLQLELREDFVFNFIDKFRLQDGTVPIATVFIEDRTERGLVGFNFGNVYRNRVQFRGREARLSTISSFDYSSPSVLRNGILWEGENYEFYPTEDVTLVVRNKGLNTVLPVNDNLLISEEQVFLADSEREFKIDMTYGNTIPMKTKITFTGTTAFVNIPDGRFIVNGTEIPKSIAGGFAGLYSRFKARLDGGEFDFYQEYEIDKDFTVVFDDVEQSMTFTSKGGGVYLDIDVTIQDYVTQVIQDYIPSDQEELNINLLSNTAEGNARYEFVLKKNGYRDHVISPDTLNTSPEGIQYYLTNVMNDVLVPYDQENDRGYYVQRSIYDGVRLGIGRKIPVVSEVLSTQNEDDGPQGYAGTPMPLGKAYAHGIYLLSDNSLPAIKENLTTYGVINADGDVTEGAFWSNAPVEALPATVDLFVTQPTRQVVDIYIRQMQGLSPVGTRNFDYSLQGQGLVYTVGGNADDFGANLWWTNANIGILDAEGNEINGVTLQELIDTGNGDEITSGPLLGQVNDNGQIIRLTSKFEGLGFEIDNFTQISEIGDDNIPAANRTVLVDLFNQWNSSNGGQSMGDPSVNLLDSPYEVTDNQGLVQDLQELNTTETVLNTFIMVETVVPNLNLGDLNSGRNGLGGFAVEI